MCRNIKSLFNFEPPATDKEIADASLQFVRKISGFREPSKINEKDFKLAVRDVAKLSRKLLKSMKTSTRPRNREIGMKKAKARAAKRFAA